VVRLSDQNVVRQDFARLEFAWISLERTVILQFWVARLSEGQLA